MASGVHEMGYDGRRETPSGSAMSDHGRRRGGVPRQVLQEHEEVPLMAIVGAFDVHRAQLTYDYVSTETGEVRRGQVKPADREHLRRWLARFEGEQEVVFAVEACTGWRTSWRS